MQIAVSTRDDGTIVVQARAEGPGIIGDAIQDVRPGEWFGDLSYDDLATAGNGLHDYDKLVRNKRGKHAEQDDE